MMWNYLHPVLRSRSNFGGSGSDPSKILRLRLLAPAPGHFQKPINQKFKVMIFFIKNEKKMNDSFAWTEQKLKRNLNSLSYFEKSPGYGSVSFG